MTFPPGLVIFSFTSRKSFESSTYKFSKRVQTVVLHLQNFAVYLLCTYIFKTRRLCIRQRYTISLHCIERCEYIESVPINVPKNISQTINDCLTIQESVLKMLNIAEPTNQSHTSF